MDLRQFVEDQIKYRLERLNGVASVDVSGGLNKEVHITVDSKRVKALGLSIDDITSALKDENKNIPVGLYTKGTHEVLIRTQGEYVSLEEIENTVITKINNKIITVSDVADVTMSHEEINQVIRIDGNRA